MIYKPHFWTFQDICDFLKIYKNNIWKLVFEILNNFAWDLSYGYNNRDSDSAGKASHYYGGNDANGPPQAKQI